MALDPGLDIDWKQVDKWLEAGAKGTEVAAALGVNYKTLERRCFEVKKVHFGEYLKVKRECGNTKLRLKQQQLAMEGDRGMLIWLGKNRLDQSDKKETKTELSVPQSINFVFDESSNGYTLPSDEKDIKE